MQSCNGPFSSRHRISGTTALAHIDHVDSDQLEDLVQQLFRVSDKTGQGENLTQGISILANTSVFSNSYQTVIKCF